MFRSQRDGGDVEQPTVLVHADGAVLVPIGCPPSWSATYFVVVSDPADTEGLIDPLRCLRLDPSEVRMSTRPIEIPAMERASVVACVVPASTTASAWVEPWVISVGSETFASLRPPIEVALAPEAGHCGLDAALAVASGRSVEELRGRRLHERRIPLESVQLLEYIRESVGRRMVVQWFDASGPVARTDVRDGAHLVDLLTDPAHRHLDHVIGFPNGWYVDGLPWLL